MLTESRYTFAVALKFLEFHVDYQKSWFLELQRYVYVHVVAPRSYMLFLTRPSERRELRASGLQD